MIEGVTKPFEIGRTPLTDDEMRAAAEAYRSGLRALIGRYGTGDINIDLDFDAEDSPVTNVLILVFPNWAESDDPGGVIANASDSGTHHYGIDPEGILRRLDSRHEDAKGQNVPPPERLGGSRRERFLQSISLVLGEQELGINKAPVDTEEVTELFAVIHREYPV